VFAASPAYDQDLHVHAIAGTPQKGWRSPTILGPKSFFARNALGHRLVDVAFEYKKLFKGAKQEEVFDAILHWLEKKGAKVKKSERPTLIESVYGRVDVEWNWHAEILRTVDFELVSTKDYVGISVFQAPVRKTEKRVLESPFQANITWRDWLDPCWEYVLSKVTPAPAATGPPMRIPSVKSAAAEKPGGPPPPKSSGAPPPPPNPAGAPPPPPPQASAPPKKEAAGSDKDQGT